MNSPTTPVAVEVPKINLRHRIPAFQWRALISVVGALSFMMLLISGVCLWVAPPGRVANWTDWTLIGLSKHERADLPIGSALVFAIASAFHLALNWRPLNAEGIKAPANATLREIAADQGYDRPREILRIARGQ